MSYTITFVTPRFGPDILGGAEQGIRSLATRMVKDNWTVRVISTCALFSTTWANHYEPGVSFEEGIEVIRCQVDRHRHSQFNKLSTKLLNKANNTTERDAWDWIDFQGPDSKTLLDVVASVNHGVLAFSPYLYQPTAKGIHLAKVPTILHAACHREPFIEFPIFNKIFCAADALCHYSKAEQQLVLNMFPQTTKTPQAVIGLPVEIDGPVEPEFTRSELGLGDEPFVLALGRVSPGKGSQELVSLFQQFYTRTNRSHLVLAGPVEDAPPKSRGVTVLGPIPHEHKFGLLAAADLLINPSVNESFSLVTIESMLVKTPVLVNGWSLPLRDHCLNSRGGLWYTGVSDFQAALNRLTADSALRNAMGEAGHRYALQFFSWPSVRIRYERLLGRLI